MPKSTSAFSAVEEAADLGVGAAALDLLLESGDKGFGGDSTEVFADSVYAHTDGVIFGIARANYKQIWDFFIGGHKDLIFDVFRAIVGGSANADGLELCEDFGGVVVGFFAQG